MTHTPGPWHVETRLEGYHECIRRDDTGIVFCAVAGPGDGSGEPAEEMTANARLIASAPELFEALERIEETARTGRADGYNLDVEQAVGYCEEQARDAIKKARGES